MRLIRTAPLALLLACAEAPPPPPALPPAPPAAPPAPVAYAPPIHITPDAPFRQAAPAGGPAVVFAAPKITELRLSNGVRVLLVERHDLPIVSVRVVARNGAGDLPWEPPGAASLAGGMMEAGTAKRTALQISDDYEALGASHSAWIDWDSAGGSVKVTTDKLDAALDVLSDVVLHPVFPAEELERLRARRLTRIQQEKNNPHAMASNATVAALYGRAHPYGHTLGGRGPEVEKVVRADLVRAHAVLFNPSRAALVVAGDVAKDVLAKKLEAAFGAWRAATPPPLAQGAPRVAAPPLPAAVGKDAPRLIVVDKPGAPQSVVSLIEVGVARSAPDRDAVSVMNAILGGMFSSRVNLNLREAHAYTYGAYSYFDERHSAGPFVTGASVKSDTTAASIGELFKEERGIQDDLVSPEELTGAKESLMLALPARFETVDSVTEALADLVMYDLPLDEYASRPARIEKITAEDVKKAAKAHLHPHTTRVLVVGDRAKVEPTLETLHLGAPEVRDAYGDPVAPAGQVQKP
jgi:zinc protease